MSSFKIKMYSKYAENVHTMQGTCLTIYHVIMTNLLGFLDQQKLKSIFKLIKSFCDFRSLRKCTLFN